MKRIPPEIVQIYEQKDGKLEPFQASALNLLLPLARHSYEKSGKVDFYFPVVNVILATSKGDIIIQQRTDNNRFDKAWGGHVKYGQTQDEAAIAEGREEMFKGLDTKVRIVKPEAYEKEVSEAALTGALTREAILKVLDEKVTESVRIGKNGERWKKGVWVKVYGGV